MDKPLGVGIIQVLVGHSVDILERCRSDDCISGFIVLQHDHNVIVKIYPNRAMRGRTYSRQAAHHVSSFLHMDRCSFILSFKTLFVSFHSTFP